MNRKSKLLLLCALLGIPALASASQLPGDPVQIIDVEPWIREWPASASTTNIGRAVSGDFTGDFSPDVWQQTGNALVLFVDPSYMEYTTELAVTASSIARLPGASPAAKSRLLFSDAAGLFLVDFTVGAANPISIAPVTLPIGAPSWANVRSLSCCDLDLDGHTDDLLAINAAGTKLLRLLYNDNPSGYTAPGNISLGSGATEAFAMTYNVDIPELPQVAVLTHSWFFIVRQDGVRSRLIAAPTPFGHIAKISQAPYPGGPLPDCVAWLRHVDSESDDQEVWLVDSRASLQDPVPLSAMNASAIFSGDIDADGSDDFGLVTKFTPVVRTYTNQRDGGEVTIDRFVSEPSRAFSINADLDPDLAQENTSTPVLADFNFDGKADLFMADRNVPRALSIQTDPPIPPMFSMGTQESGTDSLHPCFHRADFFPASYVFPENCDDGNPGETGLLMLSIKNEWPNVDPNNLPGWTLDLVVYRQAIGFMVTPGAVVHYQYPLGGGSGNEYRAAAPDVADWSFPIRIPEFEKTFLDKYYIVLRLVPPASEEPLTEYLIGFTSMNYADTAETGESFNYLAGLPGSWTMSIPYYLRSSALPCPPPDISRKDTAGAVPLLRVPRYIGGATPNPGAPDPNIPPSIPPPSVP